MSSEAGLGPAEQSAEFKNAVEQVKKLKTAPSNEDKLEIYALYKQGTRDPHFSKVSAPGMFSMEAKYKYNAWKKVADSNLPATEAQKQYVELVEKLKQKYGYDG